MGVRQKRKKQGAGEKNEKMGFTSRAIGKNTFPRYGMLPRG